MPRLIDDWVWVVMTIRQEADSESQQGKIAVAEVIRNRMKQKYNSDGSAVGTVLRAYQFSGWNTGDANRQRVAELNIEDEHTISAIEAYNEAFLNESNLVKGSQLYHSILMKVPPNWANAPTVVRTAIIGRHQFYRDTK